MQSQWAELADELLPDLAQIANHALDDLDLTCQLAVLNVVAFGELSLGVAELGNREVRVVLSWANRLAGSEPFGNEPIVQIAALVAVGFAQVVDFAGERDHGTARGAVKAVFGKRIFASRGMCNLVSMVKTVITVFTKKNKAALPTIGS